MVVAEHTKPQFIYPKSREFPFDETCEQIVRALEERNWDVPGITVDFDTSGSGAEKYRMVRHIRGDDFELWFCRVQGRLNRNLNDTASVTKIVIPRKELHVYEDHSGPTLYVYTGKNWPKDKERFMNGSKIHSKLDKERRWYLKYKGGCACHQTRGAAFDALDVLVGPRTNVLYHTHPGHESPLLVHDDDLGREYNPKRGQPKLYRTWDVFNEFTRWLKNSLLAKILEQPVADQKIDVFKEGITPYPDHLGPLFCFGKSQDAQRVYQGKLNPEELEPSDRYGLMGSGYRLLSERNDGTVPAIARDGFRWCGFGPVSTDTLADDSLEIPGHNRWTEEKFLFELTPNRADGIYVADNAPYEQARQELFDKAEAEEPERKRLTDAELAVFCCARARTIIPITEYDGSFTEPVVLINREIDLDEVELVSGPWPEYKYVKQVGRYSPQMRTLFEQAVSANQARWLDYGNENKKAAEAEAFKRLITPFWDKQEFLETIKAYQRETFHSTELEDFMGRLVRTGAEMQKLGLL